MQIPKVIVQQSSFLDSAPEVSVPATIAHRSHMLVIASVECSDAGGERGAQVTQKLRLTLLGPGPDFARVASAIEHGEYLEVEGELCSLEQKHAGVVTGEQFPVSRTTYAAHLTQISRLKFPDEVVDFQQDG